MVSINSNPSAAGLVEVTSMFLTVGILCRIQMLGFTEFGSPVPWCVPTRRKAGPSAWNRVMSALPDFLDRLSNVVREENAKAEEWLTANNTSDSLQPS